MIYIRGYSYILGSFFATGVCPVVDNDPKLLQQEVFRPGVLHPGRRSRDLTSRGLRTTGLTSRSLTSRGLKIRVRTSRGLTTFERAMSFFEENRVSFSFFALRFREK